MSPPEQQVMVDDDQVSVYIAPRVKNQILVDGQTGSRKWNGRRRTEWDEHKVIGPLMAEMPTLNSNDPLHLLHARSNSMRHVVDLDEENPTVFQTSPDKDTSSEDTMNTHIEMGQHEYETWSHLSLWHTSWRDILTKINAEDGWCLFFILSVAVFNFASLFIGILFTILAYILNRSKHPISNIKSITDVGSMYNDTTYSLWLAFSCITLTLTAAVVFVHRGIVVSKMNAWRNGENNGIEDPWKGQIGPGTVGKDSADQIAYPTGYPSPARVRLGRFLSGLIFIFGLGLNLVFNYLVHVATQNTPNGIATTLLSLLIVVFTFFWKVISVTSCDLECHKYDSTKKKSEFLKTFVFKTATSFTMLAVKNVTLLQNDESNSRCALSTIGDDLVILILIDGMSECALKAFGLQLQRWFLTKFNLILKPVCDRFGLSNEKLLPVFESADEYVEILTRQPLIMLATISKPLIAPVVGTIIGVLIYWLNKYNILRISRPAIRTSNTYKYLLPLSWTISIIAAIFVYPMGSLWLLTGNLPDTRACHIYV